MTALDKKSLSERDICTKFVIPALVSAGWDIQLQVREQHFFTDGQVLVKGKTVKRGTPKFADILLFYKFNIPLAVIEAKNNNHKLTQAESASNQLLSAAVAHLLDDGRPMSQSGRHHASHVF